MEPEDADDAGRFAEADEEEGYQETVAALATNASARSCAFIMLRRRGAG